MKNLFNLFNLLLNYSSCRYMRYAGDIYIFNVHKHKKEQPRLRLLL